MLMCRWANSGSSCTAGEERRNCWNNGHAYGRNGGEQTGGDYVTQKFNFAIVPRSRRPRNPKELVDAVS